MSDTPVPTGAPTTPAPGIATDDQRPKHRRDDVPIDGEFDLAEFGENPDTELAG